MKRFFRLKFARSVLLTLTLALVAAIPATAQAPAGGSSPGDNSAGYTAVRSDARDGNDWGWLGLLGLTGLLGLIPKRRKAEADYRATDTSRATAR